MKLKKKDNSRKSLTIQELNSMSVGSQVLGTVYNSKIKRVYIKIKDSPFPWRNIYSNSNCSSRVLLELNDTVSEI